MAQHTVVKQINTTNFEVNICENNYGWFEHNEYGEDCGGGLWFVGMELVDYDGVSELPSEVCQALEAEKYWGGGLNQTLTFQVIDRSTLRQLTNEEVIVELNRDRSEGWESYTLEDLEKRPEDTLYWIDREYYQLVGVVS